MPPEDATMFQFAIILGLLSCAAAPPDMPDRFDGKTAAEWIALLHDSNPKSREHAAHALGRLECREAVPALAEALNDRDVFALQMVEWAIERIGQRAGAAVPVLIRQLQDKNSPRHGQAASVLAELGPAAKAAVPALTAALQDENEFTRGNAALALAAIGEPAKVAVPAIRALLQDKSNFTRASAAAALRRLISSNEGLPVLIEILSQNWADVAALHLKDFGPAGKPAVPALRVILRVPGRQLLAIEAAAALWAISRDESAIPVLADRLTDKNVGVHAADALSNMGKDALPAISRLRIAASVPDEGLAAAKTLWRIEPGPSALAAIAFHLSDDSYTERFYAAEYLGKIGAPAASCLLALKKAMGDPNPLVRFYAEKSKLQIEHQMADTHSKIVVGTPNGK
jgi:HEAT repeat protein